MKHCDGKYGVWRAIAACFGICLVLVLLAAHDTRATPASACKPVTYKDSKYTVCRFDVRRDRVELFWQNRDGNPFGSFSALRRQLSDDGKRLAFAMNAGMYNDKLAPIGLYVEAGQQHKSANRRDGPGNFHLKPNGIFYMANGKAGVSETSAFIRRKIKPRLATQSGPMLVINGKLHPRFLVDSTSRKRRNGVGVRDKGHTAIFVISEDFVTFHEFGSLFRDYLKTPNALFFDGTISSLYAPELNRADWGRPMGPMVGVVTEK